MFLSVHFAWSILIISFSIHLSNTEGNKVIYGCDEDVVRNLSMTMRMLELANENMSLKLTTIEKKFHEEPLRDPKETMTQIESALKEFKARMESDFVGVNKNQVQAWYEKPLITSDGRKVFGICDKSVALPRNCAEALVDKTSCGDGIYLLYVPGFELEPFYAYCMKDQENNRSPAWTIIQRRKSNATNFKKCWEDYENGFGDLNNNFWIGLAQLHAMTATQHYELWIKLEDQEGITRKAIYESFIVGSGKQKFPLTILGQFHGDVSDALSYHVGQKFSTIDNDNDEQEDGNCAELYLGGWWYGSCHVSNLNGEYNNSNYGQGIVWKGWHSYDYSLKYVHMAIRPKLN